MIVIRSGGSVFNSLLKLMRVIENKLVYVSSNTKTVKFYIDTIIAATFKEY